MSKYTEALARLRAEVLEYKTVAESTVAGYKGVVTQLEAAIAELKAKSPDVDVTELEGLIQEISDTTDKLAAATVKNTVADPAQPNEPTPPADPGPNTEPDAVVNIPVDEIVNPPAG